MNLYVAMRPTMSRWFDEKQLSEPMNQLAFTDLLQYVAETATSQHSEIDVIGSSSYLLGIGIPRDHVERFIQVCGHELHVFYMQNTAPEWRAWGRSRVTVDNQYGVFIELGIDPYG